MKYFIAYVLVLASTGLNAQGFAGPDISGCGTPVTIGKPNPNPDHCYLWALEEGMPPDFIHDPRPVVHPKETTVYSVTVTDDVFSFKAVDNVIVTVNFGNIDVQPKQIIPNGEPQQAKASLLVNAGDWPVVWSIPEESGEPGEPDLLPGCDIDPETGWISNCQNKGTIRIEATNTQYPDCKAFLDFEINDGVKEVVVKEIPENERFLSSEDIINTLSVVTMDGLEFTAIPNDESTFPEGHPDWSGELMPEQEHAITWQNNDNLTVGEIYAVAASDKYVYVEIVPENEQMEDVPEINHTHFHRFEEVIDALGPFLPPNSGGLECGADLHFIDHEPTGTLLTRNAEKYHDPGYDQYVELDIDASRVLEFFMDDFGTPLTKPCVTLLRFAHTLDAPGVGYAYVAPSLYFEQPVDFNLFVNAKKDPSSLNSGFEGTVDLQGEIGYEIKMEVIASLSDGLFDVYGVTPVSGLYRVHEYFDEENDLQITQSWGGLQFEPGGMVYSGSPSNPVWSRMFKGAVNVLDGVEHMTNDLQPLMILSEIFD